MLTTLYGWRNVVKMSLHQYLRCRGESDAKSDVSVSLAKSDVIDEDNEDSNDINVR